MITLADRVKETTTTTGTGTLDLTGAVTGFQGFVAGVGDAAEVYYAIVGQAGGGAEGEWEVGIGTVTDAATDTLSRDTVLASSNSGNAVDFSAGTKDVFITAPAHHLSFSGALVNLTSNQAINDNSSAFVSWDEADYDVGDWWAAGSPTRLTVPAGVSRVILSAGVDWEFSNSGARSLAIEKNADVAYAGKARDFRPAAGSSYATLSTPAIEVVEGDFFQLEAAVEGAGSAQDVEAQPFTWFAIRAVR